MRMHFQDQGSATADLRITYAAIRKDQRSVLLNVEYAATDEPSLSGLLGARLYRNVGEGECELRDAAPVITVGSIPPT